jgi:hypothetical protein
MSTISIVAEYARQFPSHKVPNKQIFMAVYRYLREVAMFLSTFSSECPHRE